MVWYGPNETNLTVNYFRRTHFEKEFARLFPPTILGISTLANSWRCIPCLARERLGKWKCTMPSKYMVSVVLGLRFNQNTNPEKRGLKKVSKFDIALPIVYMTHIQTNSVTKNLNLSLMKIESLKVTVMGMNHTPRGKDAPFPLWSPISRFFWRHFWWIRPLLGFSEKKRFDIKNSDDASFTEELMANNIKTCKTSN